MIKGSVKTTFIKKEKDKKYNLNEEKTINFIEKTPFDLPHDSKLFDLRDEEKKKLDQFKKHQATLSLVERNSTLKSPLYNAGKNLVNDFIKSNEFTNEPNTPSLSTNKHKKQKMPDFIEQKREIFLVQLLIDRKVKEIERISQTRKTEKKNLADEEAKISETLNQYRLTRNQVENETKRGKNAMEDSIKRKGEISKLVKQSQSVVDNIKNEINKNTELLSLHSTYSDFLNSLTPKDESTLEFFKDPNQLLIELERIEKENLFLISKSQELTENQENSYIYVSDLIDKTKLEKEQIQNALKNINIDSKIYSNTSQMEQSEIELELKKITDSVNKIFNKCFDVKSNLSTLTMLEKIENTLESFYSQIQSIDPEALAKHLQKQELERRNELKKEKLAKDEADQKKKAAQTAERANKPIKRKTGRPLNVRVLPIKSRKLYDEQQKEIEEKAQDEFLFGEILD